MLRNFPDPAGIERRHGLAPGALLATAFAPERLTPVGTGGIIDARWRADITERLAAVIGSVRAAAAVDEWSASPGLVQTDVLGLLREVRGTVAVLLLTDVTSRLPHDLQRLGLHDAVDAIVNSADVGVAEPAPAALLAAHEHVERLLGEHVQPSDVLFVDDPPGNVEAAAATGWRTHRFTMSPPSPPRCVTWRSNCRDRREKSAEVHDADWLREIHTRRRAHRQHVTTTLMIDDHG